jgi:hypothetical protein
MRIAIALYLCVSAAARAEGGAEPSQPADAEAKQEQEEYESKRAQGYLKSGTKRYAEGKYKEALAAFRRGLEHKPLAELHYQLGQCYRALGDAASAKREYQAYLQARPDAPERGEVEGYLAAGGGAPDPAPPERPAKAPPAAAPPPTPVAPAAAEQCPEGKIHSLDGSGHCCWPEQIWYEERKSCVGSPRCPRGFVAAGLDCMRSSSAPRAAPVRCTAGKIASRGHCCWPEQVWSDGAEQCFGAPRCPSGFVARGRDCFPRDE